MYASTVLDLCETFHCLPSQLMREDASVLRLLKIRQLGTKEQRGEADPDFA